jgi:hypothetical protein
MGTSDDSNKPVQYDVTSQRWEVVKAFLFCFVLELKKRFGSTPNNPPRSAALCTGRADGSNPDFVGRTKHAILVIVRAQESDRESSVYALLQSNGWREPEIEKLRLLVEPFDSNDPILSAYYEGPQRTAATLWCIPTRSSNPSVPRPFQHSAVTV